MHAANATQQEAVTNEMASLLEQESQEHYCELAVPVGAVQLSGNLPQAQEVPPL